jgi:hypothetical protein
MGLSMLITNVKHELEAKPFEHEARATSEKKQKKKASSPIVKPVRHVFFFPR